MGPPARVRADSPSVLRRINSALILAVIRAHGPLSRTEITFVTGCPVLSAWATSRWRSATCGSP
jgi:hypothetical protein